MSTKKKTTKKTTSTSTSTSTSKSSKKKVKKKASTEVDTKVKKKRMTKAEREAKEEADKLKEKWNELNALSEGQPAKKYKLSEDFETNIAIDHPKMGWGYVLNSQNNRIEVLFEEGIKVLISNYKG